MTFSLKSVKPAEFEDATAGFEIELASLFRAIESEIYKEIRAGSREGIAQDALLRRMESILQREVVDAKS